MILSTVKVEDFDRFWSAFTTKGAEKRKQHASKGSHVFRDPNETIRYGWFSTGMRRATGTSCPILRSRQYSRRPGSKDGPRRQSLPASTTPSSRSSLPAASRH
jgi:hypothetical protein